MVASCTGERLSSLANTQTSRSGRRCASSFDLHIALGSRNSRELAWLGPKPRIRPEEWKTMKPSPSCSGSRPTASIWGFSECSDLDAPTPCPMSSPSVGDEGATPDPSVGQHEPGAWGWESSKEEWIGLGKRYFWPEKEKEIDRKCHESVLESRHKKIYV